MSKSIDDPRILRGMERQLRLRQQRLNAGERPIGWKVGFGSPTALERLQLEAPLVGFLTDRTVVPSNATISIKNWTKPAVEPEIAIYLGTDLSGQIDRVSARAAIAAIGPAIELADVNFPPDDVETILASNIYNRHIILGDVDRSRAGCQLSGLEARIYRSRKEVARTTDLQVLTGDLIGIVCHTANLLSDLGENVHAGELIITGSIIPPIWIESNEAIRYELYPIGSLSVNMET